MAGVSGEVTINRLLTGVRRARQFIGVSQSSMAKQLEVSGKWLCVFEQGVGHQSLRGFVRVASAIGAGSLSEGLRRIADHLEHDYLVEVNETSRALVKLRNRSTRRFS